MFPQGYHQSALPHDQSGSQQFALQAAVYPAPKGKTECDNPTTREMGKLLPNVRFWWNDGVTATADHCDRDYVVLPEIKKIVLDSIAQGHKGSLYLYFERLFQTGHRVYELNGGHAVINLNGDIVYDWYRCAVQQGWIHNGALINVGASQVDPYMCLRMYCVCHSEAWLICFQSLMLCETSTDCVRICEYRPALHHHLTTLSMSSLA